MAMSAQCVRRVLLVGIVAVFAGACATTNTTDPYGETESRVYQAVYNRAVERAAEAAVDAGLEVEDSGVQSASTYVINTVRRERLSGASEPVQVAQVEIYVDKLEGGAVRVRIQQKKITRTSTVGTSSAVQRDYARRIFRRLDERMERGAS